MSCEKHKAGLAVDCIKLEQTPIEKAIWSVLDEYCDAENHPLKEYDLVCDVLQKVEEAVSKCTFTGWIPCSERLPEAEGEYLCSLYYAIPPYNLFHPENDIYIHTISIQKFDGTSFKSSVIAWMPLPEPYEVGDQE